MAEAGEAASQALAEGDAIAMVAVQSMHLMQRKQSNALPQVC